jgi:hypothetical protein
MGGQMGHSGATVAGFLEIAICENDTVLKTFLDPPLAESQSSDISGVPSARPFDDIRRSRTLNAAFGFNFASIRALAQWIPRNHLRARAV